MGTVTIRDRCMSPLCASYGGGRAVLEMDGFSDWSSRTGWGGSIECERCGRRVTYVGTRCERKADVERKLRALWRAANGVG